MFFSRHINRKPFSAISRIVPKPVRTRERQSIVLDDQLIDFTLVTSRLARNVQLKINHQNELEVVVPIRFPQRDIPSLLVGKQDWIIEKLAYARQKSRAGRLHAGSVINVLGIPKKIIVSDASVKTRIKETPDSLIITSNWGAVHGALKPVDGISGAGSPLTASEKKLLETYLRKSAGTYLRERTAQISGVMGTRYFRISIRAQRSRWGSCSRDNNLNFNWKLIFMPLEVIDYIIIHELAHTVHHNHGPRFHELVAKFCPDYKELKKILKNTASPY